MNEIKFRIYDSYAKKMISFEDLLKFNLLNLIFVAVQHLKVMQYTGLKDDKGIEVYEGDIVDMGWSDQIGESHGGRVVMKNPFNYSAAELGYLIHADYLRVIGNIHDNPELIKD